MKKNVHKRILCLLLCTVLLLGVVLTSCGDKSKEELADDIQEEASEKAITVSIYLMSELPVHPDTEKEIEFAVNKITKAKFTTQVDLRYFTEDQYYTKIDEAFAARDAAKANGTLASDVGASESDTAEEGASAVEVVYPSIADYQVDLFYFGGQDRYQKYVDEKRLSNLSSELSDNGNSNRLRKYISPHFFTAVQAMGGKQGQINALPTNKTIGEYTYLLLNKEALIAAARRTENDFTQRELFTSLTCEDTKDFLGFIKQYYGETYAPLYTNVDQKELLINNLQYWGVGEDGALSDAFSVIGNYVNGTASFQTEGAYPAGMENLFANEQFVSDLTTLKQYQVDGYYRAEGDTKDFAVGYVKGGAELVEEYGEKYEMIVLETPELTAEDVYSDMFGVSYCAADVSRCMEILTYLNTNEEFRNLILYGVEGTHYQLLQVGAHGGEVEDEEDEEGEIYKAVRRLQVGTELEYKMSVHKTGNELLAYPLEGTSPKVNEYGAIQNKDSKIGLFCGFYNGYGSVTADSAETKAVRELSGSLLDRYLACATMEEFQVYLTAAKAEVAGNAAVTNQINAEHQTSMAACLAAWKTAMKIK